MTTVADASERPLSAQQRSFVGVESADIDRLLLTQSRH